MAHKKYKYYTVAKGGEKGIFDNWERCKEQVAYFKGNCYKGFYSFEDAVTFAQDHIGAEEQITVEAQGRRRIEYVKDLSSMILSA